jgi:hypothetical protein
MSELDLTPAALRTRADGVVGVVDQLATALRTLETTLQGLGSPWGTGLVGSVIGEIYQGIHDLALSSFEANAEVMSEYAEGLGTMADTFENLDWQIQQGFVNIGSELERIFGGAPR